MILSTSPADGRENCPAAPYDGTERTVAQKATNTVAVNTSHGAAQRESPADAAALVAGPLFRGAAQPAAERMVPGAPDFAVAIQSPVATQCVVVRMDPDAGRADDPVNRLTGRAKPLAAAWRDPARRVASPVQSDAATIPMLVPLRNGDLYGAERHPHPDHDECRCYC